MLRAYLGIAKAHSDNVRGDPSATLRTKGLVEPPATVPEPFDRLRANGFELKLE